MASKVLPAAEPSPHVAVVSRVVSNDVPAVTPRCPVAAVDAESTRPGAAGQPGKMWNSRGVKGYGLWSQNVLLVPPLGGFLGGLLGALDSKMGILLFPVLEN